jgi:hypothetical protein
MDMSKLSSNGHNTVEFKSAGARRQPRVLPSQINAQGETVEQELARLRQENAQLKSRPVSRLSFKVSEKGCVSVCGLGHWPTTLYPQQWLKLISQCDELKAFIETNRSKLSWK